MPVEPLSPTDLDDERVARIKEAQLRGAETRRLRTEERALTAFLELGRSEDTQEKITVARICRQAGHMSQATFYGRFPDGTADLLIMAANQMRNQVTARVRDDIEPRYASISQNDRVTVAIARLVEELLAYPNLFNVDRIIPKAVIYALSETLYDAIRGEESLSKKQRERAIVIAKYHTTSLVGILRTSLGAHIRRSDFAVVLAQRTVSQVLPVLSGDGTAYRRAELAAAKLLLKGSASTYKHKQTPLRSD